MISARPEDYGWRVVAAIDASDSPICSHPLCDHSATLAVRRLAGRRWQNYCPGHARLRGVIAADDGALSFDRETESALVRNRTSPFVVQRLDLSRVRTDAEDDSTGSVASGLHTENVER